MVSLFLNENKLLVTSDHNLLIFPNYEKDEDVHVLATGFSTNDYRIQCSALSGCGTYFATCCGKTLVLWNVADNRKITEIEVNRRASSVQFFHSKKFLAVADKSGTVSFYNYSDSILRKEDGLAIGHNSMLLDLLISEDDKFVITCDRDEKIRVSNFPNVYNIETFCLGHKSFVTCMKFFPSDPKILVSTSGDGLLIFWDYLKGKMIDKYNIAKHVPQSFSKKKYVELAKVEGWPVTKMKCILKDNVSKIACLLFDIPQICLFSYEGSLEIGVKLLSNEVINLISIPSEITFSQTHLIILCPDSNCAFKCYDVFSNNVVSEDTDKLKHLQSSSSYFTHTDNPLDFLLLYKKEYDNMSDYHDKKKARITKS